MGLPHTFWAADLAAMDLPELRALMVQFTQAQEDFPGDNSRLTLLAYRELEMRIASVEKRASA